LVAAVPLLAVQWGERTTLMIAVPTAILAVCADVLRSRNREFEDFIQRWFGFMMRPSEESEGGRIIINGATWVVISFALLIGLFPLQIASASFLIFILGDAFAALVGQRIGRHTWPGGSRTIEGSVAFMVVGTLAAATFPGLSMWSAIPAVVVGALAEALPWPLNDNIRVPLVIALTLALIEYGPNMI
jgi:dolichol kinase